MSEGPDLERVHSREAAAGKGAPPDAAPEGPRGGTRGLDRPVGSAVVDVEVDERVDLPIAMQDEPEHAPEPDRLVAAEVAGPRLTQDHRLVRRDPVDHAPVVGLEESLEGLPAMGVGGRMPPVVDIEAGPVDPLTARVEAAQVLPVVDVRVGAPDPGDLARSDAVEDAVDVSPGWDVFPRAVAVDLHRPREPGSVHLPVEAHEERVAPALRGAREAADAGVVAARDHIGELEVGLPYGIDSDRGRAPAQERDGAVPPDLLHLPRGETVEVAAVRAILERHGELEKGHALVNDALEPPCGRHVIRRGGAGQLVADPGPPVEAMAAAGGCIGLGQAEAE